MSRAFSKEPDYDSLENLPERTQSPHPNFVTARGLRLLDETLSELEHERDSAKAVEDKAALARVQRDLRYWQQRKTRAQVIEPEPFPTKIRFGVTAVLSLANGAERRFTLVGEDEADPAHELISWLSPVAQALLGREVGDVIDFQGNTAEVTQVFAHH
jgi:transcription elongation GreA/GreB family factor